MNSVLIYSDEPDIIVEDRIISWDYDFTDIFYTKYHQYFVHNENTLISIDPNIKVLRVKGRKNYYKPSFYNPKYYVVFKLKYKLCEITAHIYKWNSHYNLKNYDISIVDNEEVINSLSLVPTLKEKIIQFLYITVNEKI